MSTFYISTSLDATRSLVYALNDNTARELPTLFLGDSIPVELTFTDGLGGYSSYNGEQDLIVKIAIGNLSGSEVYVIADNFTFSNNVYSTTLVLMTEALAQAMTGLDSISPSFEVQIERSNGESFTVYQSTVTVRNQLISSSGNILNGSDNIDVLFAHYPANQIINGTLPDSTGQGRDLKINGDVTVGDGRYGNAYHFNGYKSHAHKFDDANFSWKNLGGAYSIALFVKPDKEKTTQDLGIFAYGQDEVSYKQYMTVWQKDRRLTVRSDYLSNNFEHSYTYNYGEWVHIALVKESDTTQHLYINGELYKTAVNSNWGVNEATRIRIGKFGNYGFEGKLDDIRIYDRALNGNEVRDIYNISPLYSDWVLDSSSDINLGDPVKFLQDKIAGNGVNFNEGEITTVITQPVVGADSYHLQKSDNRTAYINQSGRGTVFEKLSAPIVLPDSDGDGIPDANDDDHDNDGITDNADADHPDNAGETDTDGDGIIDSYEDDDADGAENINDYFSDNANYTQSKADLDGYSLDTYKAFATGDIIRILQDFTQTEYQGTDTVDLNAGDYYIVSHTGSQWIRFVINNADYQLYDTSRGTKWEVVNPQADLTPEPVPEGTQYYIWGSDDINGVGYYYPVYTETSGLTSYHSHTFAGTTYYMKNTDSNHAQLGLPTNNTLPPAPDNLEPPQFIQLVWGSNYENKCGAMGLNLNKQGYTWINGGSTTNTTTRDIDITSGTWRYNYDGSFADIFSSSIHEGQGIIGDMSFAHTFQIYKYKVTSVATDSSTFSGGTANRKIGIEALGTWDSASARQTAEDASLELMAEYYNQPSDSIWRDASSNDYGAIVFNQTKNIFYWFLGTETGFIYANTLTETTAFEVDDEIIVLFE